MPFVQPWLPAYMMNISLSQPTRLINGFTDLMLLLQHAVSNKVQMKQND
jgi:hypothetical protein